MVHGLNLKPEKMDAIARSLADAGITLFRIELSGHGLGSLSRVSGQEWLAETDAGYRAAADEAARLGVRLFLVGYSLGGLLGEAVMSVDRAMGHARFDRVVLIAPAIALRPVAALIRPLFRLGPGLALPSRSLPHYRVHARTPVAAYAALFDLLALLRKSGYSSANLPTLVLDRRGDELVSLDGLRRLVRRRRLTLWTIVEVARAPARIPGHLLIDSESLGAAAWQRTIGLILEFLLR